MAQVPQAVQNGFITKEEWDALTPSARKHFNRTAKRAKAAGVSFQEYLQLDKNQRIKASLADRGPSVWTEEKIAWLRDCYEREVPASTIAAKLGVQVNNVSAIASKHGIRRRDYRKPKHVRVEFSYAPQVISHQGHGRKRFYVYAYLRTDGTPHYIGKGTGRRAWQAHTRTGPKGGVVDRVPRDPNRIRLLAVGLTDQESLDMERDLISILGRFDEGGCLYNFTVGGDSPQHSQASIEKMSRHAKARGMPMAVIEAAQLARQTRRAEKIGMDLDAYLALSEKDRRHMNQWLRYNEGKTIADYRAAFADGHDARRMAVSQEANKESIASSAQKYGIPLDTYLEMSINERARVKGWLQYKKGRTFDQYKNEKSRGRTSRETAEHFGIPWDDYMQMDDLTRRRVKAWLKDNPQKSFKDYQPRFQSPSN